MSLPYVIPLGNGSLADNLELKFSLRSIEKYVSGISHIVIVGNCPEWLTNVEFQPMKDLSNKFVFRDNNIREKLNVGLSLYGSIVGGNDDYYIF